MKPDQGDNTFSVVVPVYNSADTLSNLLKEIKLTFERMNEEFEIVFVNDASSDNSWETLNQIAKENDHVSIIELEENSGQNTATLCGIHHAKGNAIITIDDDLQYPPTEIEKLIKAYKTSGSSFIFGDPVVRRHGSFHGPLAILGKFFLHYFTLPAYKRVNFFTTFRLFDKSFFLNGSKPSERHLFFIWEFPVEKCRHIPVEHQERKLGKSGYRISTLIKHYNPFLLYSGINLARYVVVAITILMIMLKLRFLLVESIDSVGIIQSFIRETWFIFIVFLLAVITYVLLQKSLVKMKAINYKVAKKVLNGDS